MTREELKTATNDELIDELNYCGYDSYYRDYRDDVVAEIKKRMQEPVLDRDCEHCSKTQGSLGCCDTVSNKWVYSCKEGQREYLLNKIKAEIEALPKTYPFVNHFDMYVKVSDVTKIIDKYKSESNG